LFGLITLFCVESLAPCMITTATHQNPRFFRHFLVRDAVSCAATRTKNFHGSAPFQHFLNLYINVTAKKMKKKAHFLFLKCVEAFIISPGVILSAFWNFVPIEVV